MKRRTFVRSLLAPAVGAVSGFHLPLANAANYEGKLFVFVQADGGWDPTSFCDPKMNTPGEKVINHWAENGETRQAGNLFYADFANNAPFFEKFYDRMLVINGVDAQTNSHTVGVAHNWSGRVAEGYPSMTALLAAHHGPELPLAYLRFGGFSYTAGLTTFTLMNEPELIRNIATPNLNRWGSTPYLRMADWERFQRFRAENIARLNEPSQLLPRAARSRELYAKALSSDSTEGLKHFASLIPQNDELDQLEGFEGPFNSIPNALRRQALFTILAFKAKVAVSADLLLGGFDTHFDHDREHTERLGRLTDSVDFLWDFAEKHEVADRLVVVVGSDFGRTNHYNVDDGKDHWPIGSFIVMEKNQTWTNQVIGETDALHFAHKIHTDTLQRDDANGTIIHPKHIHKALRRYFGIEDSLGAQAYPFRNTEDFAFFE